MEFTIWIDFTPDMNTKLLKFIDKQFGRFVCGFFRPLSSVQVVDADNIIVIRPGGIGDAVLLAPVIIAIRRVYPGSLITILAEQRNAGIFKLVPGVDNVFCYDNPREFIRVLRTCYDLVIDSEQWHRMSAIVARLVRTPVKIGFDTNERRRMFTNTIPYSHDDYEAISFAHLLEPLGINSETVKLEAPFLTLPVDAIKKAVFSLESFNGKPFAVIFPGASIPERRWGTERFRAVAKRISENNYGVVVIGGPEDREDGEKIAGTGGLNLAGITTLAETAAVIARSCLLISGDSGVLHLAVGLDIPTVSLFGPGIAAKWAPAGEKHMVLNHNLSCSPCTRFGTTPPCPFGVRCLVEITPEEVINAAELQLSRLETTPQI